MVRPATVRQPILDIINSDPARLWTTQDIIDRLPLLNKTTIRNAVVQLAHQGRIEKVGRNQETTLVEYRSLIATNPVAAKRVLPGALVKSDAIRNFRVEFDAAGHFTPNLPIANNWGEYLKHIPSFTDDHGPHIKLQNGVGQLMVLALTKQTEFTDEQRQIALKLLEADEIWERPRLRLFNRAKDDSGRPVRKRDFRERCLRFTSQKLEKFFKLNYEEED
jgi:hypothetical protein